MIPKEALYFAKFENSETYAVVHSSLTGKFLFPGEVFPISNLNYDNFCLCVRGASFRKDSEKLDIYNGIPLNIKYRFFANKKFSCLKENKLKEFLKKTELYDEFRDKIKTIK